MTLLEPQRGDIPRPHPSRWSAPYWEGCARGELLFQRCGDCGGITPHARGDLRRSARRRT